MTRRGTQKGEVPEVEKHLASHLPVAARKSRDYANPTPTPSGCGGPQEKWKGQNEHRPQQRSGCARLEETKLDKIKLRPAICKEKQSDEFQKGIATKRGGEGRGSTASPHTPHPQNFWK